MADPSRVRVCGPLKSFATGFARSLVQQGYTPLSATFQLHLMAHVSRWLMAERLDTRELRTADIERFLKARRRAGYTQYLTARAMRPMLTFLCSQGVVLQSPSTVDRNPVDGILDRYGQYLTEQRGLTSGTVRVYRDAVRPFLQDRLSFHGGRLAWDALTAADLARFLVSRTSQQSHPSVSLTVTALRSLLRFLHADGTLTRSLAASVPAVAGHRLAGLPKSLTREELQRLLQACDRRTGLGRRDFAVLVTLARLGLRAGEVAALRLTDIDWRAGTMTLHGKGHVVDALPLPTDVGTALVAYLRRDRPRTATDRTVFVRARAPHDPLSPSGVTKIVFAAAQRAGLGRLHAHRLRHTAATLLLGGGASLTEIGQLLRHRRASTTAIYAKVDYSTLRTIARPWTGGVA